jgi:hypothetical protein
VVAVAAPLPAYCTTYLSIEEAQKLLFPGASFEALPLRYTEEEKKAIEQYSGVSFSPPSVQAWKARPGGYFFVDRVLGKHQYFTYALALSTDGRIRGLEILSYSESRGGEIRRPSWRAHFLGQSPESPPQWERNIPNISGATLSCKHLTNGVRRLLAIYRYVLKG